MSSENITIFIRHGDKEEVRIDPVLSLLGCFQAIISGQNLARFYLPPLLKNPQTKIVVSPFKRTIETAILAIAQSHSEEIPDLILDPVISETVQNENCIGSEKDVLLGWINEALQDRLTRIVNDAVLEGYIDQTDQIRVSSNIEKIYRNLDKSSIVNYPDQEWWPLGPNGDWEDVEDAQRRYKKFKGLHTGPSILFTHSTFTADVLNDLRPVLNFGQSALTRDIPQNDNEWIRDRIAHAGIYELTERVGKKCIAVTGFFMPGEFPEFSPGS